MPVANPIASSCLIHLPYRERVGDDHWRRRPSPRDEDVALDGTASAYKHLEEVLVADGELVPRGSVLGLSDSTGYSTGRHAHVVRQEDCGELSCMSLPLEFEEVGVPVTGQSVTSENCP